MQGLLDIANSNLDRIKESLLAEEKQSIDAWNIAFDTLNKHKVAFNHEAVQAFLASDAPQAAKDEVMSVWFPLGRETEGKFLTAKWLKDWFGVNLENKRKRA